MKKPRWFASLGRSPVRHGFAGGVPGGLASLLIAGSILSPFALLPRDATAQTTDESQLAAIGSQIAYLQSLLLSITGGVANLLGTPQAQAQSSTITIGETTVLPTGDNGNGNLLVTQSATLSQTATIQSLSFYVTTAGGNLRLGIYDATGPSGGPGAKRAETASFTPTTGWNTQPVLTPVSLPPGTYWLAYLPSSNTLAFVKKSDASSSGRYYSFTYGTMPATFSTTPNTTPSHWSFYATLSTAPDTTPPSTPQNLQASAVSSSQVNLSWAPSTDDVAVTGYRVYRNGTQIAQPTTNSFSDSGLNPSTTYTYTVQAVDGAGNTSSQSASAQATTQAAPPPDTTPPSTPTNLQASAQSSSQINLSWAASTDNIGVTGYKVERCQGSTCTNFAQIAQPTGTSYSDSGLLANTTYRYQVRATDAAGNNSGYSTIVAATTQSGGTGGNTITATSCSSSAVQSAVNAAADGDTVIVPTGNCTWNSAVDLSNSKGVSLICATQGSCVIAQGVGTVIRMNGTLSGVNNHFYRISGFEFKNAPNGTLSIWFYGNGTLSNFRIDHNTFTNFAAGSIAIHLGEVSSVGKFYGVIDHNTFSGSNNIMAMKYLGPGDPSQWPASVRGTGQNVFLEDNVFDFPTNTNLGLGCMDAWRVAAVVFRHNDTKNCLVTAHGVSHETVVNFEAYNNNLRRTANSGGWEDGTRLFHHQGSGEMFLWGNRFFAASALSGSALAITHYRSASPSVAGYNSSFGRCDGTSSRDGNRPGQLGYPCWLQPGRAPSGGNPIYGTLSPVYAWLNVDNTTGNKVSVEIENPWNATNPSVDDHIKPNRDYYDAVSTQAQTSPTSPFNGTTGMGFGTLANRPTTCTPTSEVLDAGNGGVAYWAPDVGPQGTLYRCSSINTWTVHYTPYTYPHPLVSGGTTTPPPAPDSIPPSTPTNLQASAQSSSQINLSWTASTDNIGVANYRLERCQGASCTTFSQVATPSTNSFFDTGLQANTTYRYQVRATDAAGNNSGYSMIASATTLAPAANKFTIGDRIIVVQDTATRATPSSASTSLGSHSVGELGTITGGPVAAEGFTWWQINYDIGADGWSGHEDRFDKYTASSLRGDVNQDGTVNTLDWSIMNSQWFTSNPQSDLNTDGFVNSIDFGLLNRNWGLSS